MSELTKIYLNDWENYNNGSIGYGWFTPDEAVQFMEDHETESGREWFIADIDNYLGVEFKDLEYSNVETICEAISALEDMDDYERDEIIALMEYRGCELEEAIETHDNYSFYEDIDAYHDSCDELIECDFANSNDFLLRYFDYDAYHRDCDFDIYEANNGVCIFG